MSKRIIVVALLCIVAVIAVVFATHRPIQSLTIGHSSKLPVSLASAISYTQDSLVFSNDRSFVQYSLTSKDLTLLSVDTPFSSLRNIDSVSLSQNKNYILFHASDQPTGGPLLDYLQLHNRDVASDHWWVYDVNQKQFIALDDSVLRAKFDQNNVRTLTYDNGQESIQTLGASSSVAPQIIYVTGVSDFWPVRGGLLVSDDKNNLSFTKDGSVMTKVFENNTEVVGSNNQGQLYVLLNSTKGRTLARYDFTDHKLTTIDSNIVGNPILNAQQKLVLYSTQKDITKSAELRIYNESTSKKSRIIVKGLSDSVALNSPIAILSSTSFIALDDKQQPYLLSNTDTSIPVPSSSYARQVSTDGVMLQILYDESSNRLLAHLAPNNMSTQMQAVYIQLRADGLDPYVIAVEFVGDDFSADVND